jgi:REP element-mobilizing transposase RayT
MNEKQSSPHSKHLRIGRVSLPHQIYTVTVVTKLREKIFSRYESAAIAARCFYNTTIAEHADTLAFVVMPDHIHWLLQLGESSSLSAAVRIYKAKVSVLLGQRIWQPGFHDHAVRDDEDLVNVARYIVANPLRAGLCGKIGDYPYWNARWL